jgi:hypothetical protein
MRLNILNFVTQNKLENLTAAEIVLRRIAIFVDSVA